MLDQDGDESTAYQLAQRGLADLKSAVFLLLLRAGKRGLSNAEIGRGLGIYHGHEGHVGHIPRTLLALMKAEGVVVQDSDNKRWELRAHAKEAKDSPD